MKSLAKSKERMQKMERKDFKIRKYITDKFTVTSSQIV